MMAPLFFPNLSPFVTGAMRCAYCTLPRGLSGSQLPAQGLLHQLANAVGWQVLAQQEVELGERRFGGHVKAQITPARDRALPVA